jgi:CubicO group peptidase (beta-lactamase class C family)
MSKINLLPALVCLLAGSLLAAEHDLESAKRRYQETIESELANKVVPGVSIAWVVDGRLIHSGGYGQADRERNLPASPDTIYRAGSISKLFNAVAAMQLVEQGKLDLDAPIDRALPEFHIVVPFPDAKPITIRQLLCHRSGMIRECPLGGYLDDRQPTIPAVIAGIADCALVNPPNTKTRYSNVGPTMVGRAVEVQSGLSFVDYQQQHVLGRLKMTSSAWLMNDDLRPKLARGMMRIARGDGTYTNEAAPQFELGTLPAGNLYTTAVDLARFASFLMGGDPDTQPSSHILRRDSLDQMFAVQLTEEPTGFGLGFFAGQYRGHKTVQHTGAVYGFSTSMVVLPDKKIAAIVLANADIATAAVRRLMDTGLDLLLESVHREPLPPTPKKVDADTAQLAELVGDYESPGYWARLDLDGTTLRGNFSGQPMVLTPTDSPLGFVADSRLMNRSFFEFERAADGKVVAFTAMNQRFERIDPANAPQAPQGWQNFVGSYGPKFIPLVVAIRHGHLYATVENEYDYRLRPLNRVTFALPPGMYADEQAVFQTDAQGKATAVVFANMVLPRRGK